MKRLNFILAVLLIITSGSAQVNEKSERKFYKQSDWEFNISSSIGRGSSKLKRRTIIVMIALKKGRFVI